MRIFSQIVRFVPDIFPAHGARWRAEGVPAGLQEENKEQHDQRKVCQLTVSCSIWLNSLPPVSHLRWPGTLVQQWGRLQSHPQLQHPRHSVQVESKRLSGCHSVIVLCCHGDIWCMYVVMLCHGVTVSSKNWLSHVRLVGRVKKVVRRTALRGNNKTGRGYDYIVDHQVEDQSELSWLPFSTIRISSASTVLGWWQAEQQVKYLHWTGLFVLQCCFPPWARIIKWLPLKRDWLRNSIQV